LASLLPALPVALAALLALRRLDDSDTWWHLAAGRWIVQHASVPRTDPLSFTVPDHAWVNVQWLFDLILYELFQRGGAALLVVAAALTYGLAVVLLVKNLRLQVGAVLATVLAIWATAVAQERFTVRPEMVSFALLQLLLWLFASAARDEGRRLWLVPLIMVLWANTHSLFIIGVLLIGCHLASAVLVRLPLLPAAWRQSWPFTPPADRRLMLWGSVAILATLLNPYGVTGALFPIELASRINGSNPIFAAINEFRSPFSGYAPSFALDAYKALLTLSLGVVSLAALLTALPRGTATPSGTDLRASLTGQVENRFHVARFLFFLALAFLSVLARRNMALFAMAAAPFVGECLLVVYSALPLAIRRTGVRAATALVLILPLAAAAAAWFVISNGFYRWDLDTHEFGVDVQESSFPIRAAAFARELQLPPRLYNDLTSGGYLSWDAPVDGGVYIDGRLEVYDADFFSAYMAAASDPQRWQADADRAGIGTVLFDHRWDQRSVLLRYLLQDPRWAFLYYDEMAVIFVRREGNEELAGKAQAGFSTMNERTLSRILAPEPWWRWPAGRVLSLWNYGNVSSLIGQDETAAKCFTQLLTLNLPPPWEMQIRLRLATYYLSKDDRVAARTHLQRAAELSPGDPMIARMLAQAGS
jgi:hypothetical protein